MNNNAEIAVLLVQGGCNANELASYFDVGRAEGELLMRQAIRKLDTWRRDERIKRDRNHWSKKVARFRALAGSV